MTSKSLTLKLHLFSTVHPNQSWGLELKRRRGFMSTEAVAERRGNFTPQVMLVDGLRPDIFLKTLAANLAHKWGKPFSQTCGYVRARLAFAIIRASSLCLRCSRVKWRSGLGFDDGDRSILYLKRSGLEYHTDIYLNRTHG